MKKLRKITAHIEDDLLEDAMLETGEGISNTIREGLRSIKMRRIYREVLALRGKCNVSIDLADLRQDKR